MSKYQTTIKLMKKNEDGKYKQVQFESAEFLPGPVVEEAAEVMEGMQNAVDGKSVSEALSRAYSFIADTLFEGHYFLPPASSSCSASSIGIATFVNQFSIIV